LGAFGIMLRHQQLRSGPFTPHNPGLKANDPT
jgi:hypothetical protein